MTSFNVRNVRSLLHEVKTEKSGDPWKSKLVSRNISMLSTLQVCSVFYLAKNTNGTLGGFFYHLFSVI